LQDKGLDFVVLNDALEPGAGFEVSTNRVTIIGRDEEPIALPLTTLLTSMFLHGGWLHLIGNMWYLWIFGDNVEDRLGHGRYLLLYVAGGAAAALAQVAIAPDSRIPMLGASGAIASVLGAYIVLYPRASVYTWVPIFLGIVRIPAVVWLGLWFALQLLSGVASLGAQQSGGVAFFAHAGGFVAGVVLVKLLDRGPRWRPGARPLTTFP